MSKLHNVEVTVGANFQDFDHGGEATVFLPKRYGEKDVMPGDRVHWVCAQFDGITTIISREGKKLTIMQ